MVEAIAEVPSVFVVVVVVVAWLETLAFRHMDDMHIDYQVVKKVQDDAKDNQKLRFVKFA